MRWMLGLIVLGYGLAIATFGWLGLLAAAVHVAALLLTTRRR